jgi:hypothetical protein
MAGEMIKLILHLLRVADANSCSLPYLLMTHYPNKTGGTGTSETRLLDLDVGGADHRAPLFSFCGNELSEVGRRTGKGCATGTLLRPRS